MLDECRLPVTDQGVVVPKGWFGQAQEVVVRNENGRVNLEPVATQSPPAPTSATPKSASIWDIGSDPIMDDAITDSSTNHDRYLYGRQS
ncbi:hypothetical protein [Lacipirellula sp.]|uniref:hypothetical protein n=1 Tax=Lacipirellula sp. TaxID=2691419 RepID=UPI003D0BD0C2